MNGQLTAPPSRNTREPRTHTMSDNKHHTGGPDRARLSKLENYEWAYEVLKLHREFPAASRDQVLDALDTAYEQNAKAPLRDRIEEFARGLLTEWQERPAGR